MFKNIAVAVMLSAVVFTGSVRIAHAEGITIVQLVELLINLGVISPDKVPAARAFINGQTTGTVNTAAPVVGQSSIAVTAPTAGFTGYAGGKISVSFSNTAAGQQYRVALRGKAYEQSLGSITASASQASDSFTLPASIPSGSYSIVVYQSDNGSEASSPSFSVVNQSATRYLSVACSGVPNADFAKVSWSATAWGGSGPFIFSWSAYNDIAAYAGGSTQSPSFTASYSAAGAKQASVTVRDSQGAIANATCSSTLGAKTSSIVSPVLSTASWYADDSSTWPTVSTVSTLNSNQAVRVKGTDGIQYFEGPRGISSGKLTSSPSAGTTQLIVYVYDYAQNTYAVAEKTVSVNVSNKPTAANLSISCSGSAYTDGPKIGWSAVTSGGMAPYIYSWNAYNDVSAYLSGSTQSSSFTASYASSGSKQALVTVRDAAGKTATYSCSAVAMSGTVVSSNAPYHSADTNRDWKISDGELARMTELYGYRSGTTRTGQYHTQSGTVDNYATGPGSINGYHSADENKDGAISLIEYTRVIELKNSSGGYKVQAGTEDGFAPVAVVTPPTTTLSAPTLSTTSWYADDSSTWPTVSTASTLNSNQAIRVKTADGAQYFEAARGTSSGKLTSSPSVGTTQLIVYIYDYAQNTYAISERTIGVSVTNKPVVTTVPTSAYISLSSYCVVPGTNVTVTGYVAGGAASKVLEKDTNADGVYGTAATWGSGAGTNTFTTSEGSSYSGRIDFKFVVNGQVWDTKSVTVSQACAPAPVNPPYESTYESSYESSYEDSYEDSYDESGSAFVGIDAVLRLIKALK
jgi:hypothetical protein